MLWEVGSGVIHQWQGRGDRGHLPCREQAKLGGARCVVPARLQSSSLWQLVLGHDGGQGRMPVHLRLGTDCQQPSGKGPVWSLRPSPSTISKYRVFLPRMAQQIGLLSIVLKQSVCVPLPKKMGSLSAKWERRWNICEALCKASEFQ